MRGLLIVFCGFVFSEFCSGRAFDGLFSSRNTEVKSKRCTYMRTHGMLAVDCYALGLTHIPSVLRSNIEVLDVTYNRIREILNNSFINYPSLRILYLSDNSISYIESGAFDPLEDLEVLDLTLNSMHFIPDSLSSLPVLRKLMLGSNPFLDVLFSKMLPSIQYLSLSNCKLKKFPDFTFLPGLLQLNMSDNQIQTIDLHQVAPMCRLQLLDLRGNPKLYSQEHCRCQVLVTWIKRRQGDHFKLFPEFDSICKNTTEGRNIVLDRELCFDNETNLLLEEGDMIASSCESEVMKYGSGPLRLRGSVAWTVIAIAVCASVLVLFSGLYCFRRRHQARQSARDNAPAHGKGWRT
ncbi:hypothetical protein RUM43_006627 [Polyplax serrata]|uniref:Uncharacterized protein n=1 Tax=Polyplax serrata TaxID=468196 RepID=A0AAN8PYW3_POLSC